MKTTPWIVIYGYCAMRCIEGSDGAQIKDRVAFIEKTPRVRIAPWTNIETDFNNWREGDKGSGGGDPEKDQTYGYDPDSRAWCDEQLKKLGFILG